MSAFKTHRRAALAIAALLIWAIFAASAVIEVDALSPNKARSALGGTNDEFARDSVIPGARSTVTDTESDTTAAEDTADSFVGAVIAILVVVAVILVVIAIMPRRFS